MSSHKLRRSLLFVPGSARRMIEKAATLPVDGVILDLEDGVAPEQKDAALAQIMDALGSMDFGMRERIVRLDGDRAHADRALHALAPLRPDALLAPKVETPAYLAHIDQQLAHMEASLQLATGSIRLFAMIETALGLMNLREICQATPRLDALVFGGEDYAASIGAQRTREGVEVLFARSMIVAAAGAYALDAIDGVYVNYQDGAGFAADCRLGRQLGFTGKTIIHPAQVDGCNQHFTPAADEVAWAQEVVGAMEAAARAGIGAVTVRGAMVDKPVLRAAQRILHRAPVG